MRFDNSLNLSASYKFDISVRSENECMCYGELELSPSKITLKLFFESQEGRFPLFGLVIDSLVCSAKNYTFILLNLERISGTGLLLDSDTERIGFRKMEYSADSIFYKNECLKPDFTFIGFSIESKDLIPWIGKTATQESLLIGQDAPEKYSELEIWIESEQFIGIDYTVNQGLSTKDLNRYKSLTPVLHYSCNPTPISEFSSILTKHITLINFLMGRKFELDTVNVSLASSRETGSVFQTFAVYIKTAPKLGAHQSPSNPIFIELSRNSAHPSKFDTIIPDSAFINYWSKDKFVDLLVKRYVTVRDLEDPEEQFIGMFRILEKCVFREKTYFDKDMLDGFLSRLNTRITFPGVKRRTVCDFSKRVLKLNEQKADVKSNILVFIKSMPAEVSSYIGIDIEIAKTLADLRNDITHANPYVMSEERFYSKQLQCILLATCALLTKLDLPWKTIGMSVAKINPYHGIKTSMHMETFIEHFDSNGNHIPIGTK